MGQAYKIPVANWETLLVRIEKLTRRAKKLGLAVPILNKIGEIEETLDNGFIRPFYLIEVESEPICVNGWQFVASIDVVDGEVGKVINRVPGVLPNVDLPAKYRTTTDYCEHCGTNRRRNSVYVLYNASRDEWKQVGKNCLGVFLGGVDPEGVVANAETLIDLDGLCSGAQSPNFFGMGDIDRLDLVSTLVFTAFTIKKLGWLSRSKSRELAEQETYRTATADIINEAYFTPQAYKSEKVKDLLQEYKAIKDSEKQILETEVEAAIDWIRSTDDEQNSDYLHNMLVCCSSSSFSRKHIGIVVSLLAAHKYATTTQTHEVKPISNYVGIVGTKEIFNLKVEHIQYWPTAYGTTTAVFMKDVYSNIVIWKASKDPNLEVGGFYQITGKIKNHNEYKGNRQTILSHCKVLGNIGGF